VLNHILNPRASIGLLSIILLNACPMDEVSENKEVNVPEILEPELVGPENTVVIPENSQLIPRQVKLSSIYSDAVAIEDYEHWDKFLQIASFNSRGYWEAVINSHSLPTLSMMESDFQYYRENPSFISDELDDYNCDSNTSIAHTFDRTENSDANTITFEMRSVMDKCESDDFTRDGEYRRIATYYFNEAGELERIESSLKLSGVYDQKRSEADLDPEIDSIAFAENFLVNVDSEWTQAGGQAIHSIEGESVFAFATYIDGVRESAIGYLTYSTDSALVITDPDWLDKANMIHSWYTAGHTMQLTLGEGNMAYTFDGVSQ